MSTRAPAPFGRRPSAVVRVEEVGAYTLVGVADDSGPSDPAPGRFYMLATASGWGGEDGRPFLPRAFSFARVRPRDDGTAELQFLVDAIGPGTRRFARARVGEELWLAGPFGCGFERPNRVRPLLVGGGIGVAPLVALQDSIGPDAPALIGFRDAHHARAAGLFEGATVLATDDGSEGRRALVTELLREELDRDPDAVVHACGPPPMLEAVRALCSERGVAASLAMESGMACGFGACMGCVVPTRTGYVRLCVDGPVVDAASLDTALAP